MIFVGRDGTSVLFSSETFAVVVDEQTNTVLKVGSPETLTASGSWSTAGGPPADVLSEIASASVTDLDIHVLSDNDRLYTIPKAVQAEARRGLEWHREHGRGGTPVGMNTARTLSNGGQIGIKKLRHIAKYFPRHEVDKKGQGYKPSEEGYPSRGRIAWALWGGDAGQRWASAIVEREDAKAASNIEMLERPTPVELDAFVASASSVENSEEFFVRLFANGSGFDRLYRRDVEGSLSVWDNGVWADLGESITEFHLLDSELDTGYVSAHYHVPVEPEAALVASAYLDNSPSGFAQVSDLDRDEVLLAAAAFPELDWVEIDAVLAAGEVTPAAAAGGDDELAKIRAQAVKNQPRDAMGQFAKKGGRVNVKSAGGAAGVIQSIEGSDAVVKMDSGATMTVPVAQTQAEGSNPAPDAPAKKFTGAPLDTSGILGQPRAALTPPAAKLPDNTLPPLTSDDVKTLLNDWPAWVADQRSKVNLTEPPSTHVNTNEEDHKAPNAFNDPYLRKWLDQKVKGKDGSSSYPNRSWYNPMRRDDIEDKRSAKSVGTVGPSSGGGSSSKKPTTKNLPYKKPQDSVGKPKNLPWNKKSGTKPGGMVSLSDESLLAAGENVAITPKTSDVPPVYMAVVAPDDPQAVMDLICLVPASTQSTKPAVFTFKKGEWVADERMLNDLKSPTPPPVVVLDNAALQSVVGQINTSAAEQDKAKDEAQSQQPAAMSLDEYLSQFWSAQRGILPLTAGGGLDRNRGNAEKLRHYWTVGKGGLKIRWNTPGDWTRCVRHLSKYLGPRAKGYCALRHKEMTGLWTGDKAHRQMYGRKGKGVFALSDEMILSSDQVVEQASLRARADEARQRVLVASGGFASPFESYEGAKFTIPLVVPEGVETGDGRKFSKGAITMRELPLPLMWQIKTDEGHYGSVVVGRIDSMERTEDGIGNACGVFDNGEYGREAERLVRGGFLRGISADLDKFEADEDSSDDLAEGKSGKKKKPSGKLLISQARVMGVTLVPKPAFQECFIKLDEESNMDAKEQDALVACASVVASIPVVPPREWFNDPKLAGPTPLTVTDDGRVFGHIAAWHVDHIGLAFGTKPPRSKSGYSYFHTGVLRCDDGKDVPVGQLTLAGGHAALNADARAAAKHYDDTGSAFADVHAGEDAYGIWVAGSLRPEVSAQQVRAIRASAPSGDWRPIQGNLELVAVCQVNVPGFPIARARVASGQMYALVAAGAAYLAQLKDDPEYMLQVAESVKARFAAIRSDVEKSPITAGIGMSKENEPLTVEVLEHLLSDVVSFNYRVWGFHWNVTGEDFNQYHDLFGKIQEDVEGSIDPIAENIRKIGGFPPISLREYAETSTIGEPKVEGGDPRVLVADLLAANQILIEELKAAFVVFNQANEQGVANFLSERLDMHQKWAWQLASSITEGEIVLSEDEDMEGAFEAVFSNLVDRGLIASTQPYGDFAYVSEKTREKAAEKGEALPDGSFPIRNVSDLKNAIHAYGRAKPAKRAAVRSHIKKRAKALGKDALIPETFNSAEIEAQELAAVKLELSARVHGLTAAGEAGVEGAPKA